MICPQTKAKCKNLAFCDMSGKCLEHEADLLTPPPVAGRTLAADCAPTRGHAMLAEIERLVDALVDAAIYSDIPDAQAARAGLMAAIRAYGRE